MNFEIAYNAIWAKYPVWMLAVIVASMILGILVYWYATKIILPYYRELKMRYLEKKKADKA